MVLRTTISLDQLQREGKEFKWERPECCPKCSGRVWGHGFCSRYFSGFSCVFWIKRYRCSNAECGAVITMRPEGYWPRVHTSIRRIFEILSERLSKHRWQRGVSRQGAGHWLRNFLRFCRKELPDRVHDPTGALYYAYESGLRFV